MLQVDLDSNIVKLMQITAVGDKLEMSETETHPTAEISLTHITPFKETIKRLISEQGWCLDESHPFCVHGVFPNARQNVIELLFMPMLYKFVLPKTWQRMEVNSSAMFEETFYKADAVVSKSFLLSLYHHVIGVRR